jgi:hypothetical protein
MGKVRGAYAKMKNCHLAPANSSLITLPRSESQMRSTTIRALDHI